MGALHNMPPFAAKPCSEPVVQEDSSIPQSDAESEVNYLLALTSLGVFCIFALKNKRFSCTEFVQCLKMIVLPSTNCYRAQVFYITFL